MGLGAQNHLGSRSPLSSATAWQRGRSSLVKSLTSLPPGAASGGEFMTPSTFSTRTRRCVCVLCDARACEVLAEQSADV